MNVSVYIILALLISIFASSTNVDLFTNTNFLLLMLLALGGYFYPNNSSNNHCCNRSNNLLDINF